MKSSFFDLFLLLLTTACTTSTLLLAVVVESFTVPPQQQKQQVLLIPTTTTTTTRSHHKNNNNKNNNRYYIIQERIQRFVTTTKRNLFEHVSLDEIDAARLQYEALIGPLIFTATTTTTASSSSSLSNNHNNSKNDANNRSLLTNVGRKRKQIEIELLQSLLHSDDAIDELMSLWMKTECLNDIDGCHRLQIMEYDCSSGHNEIETTLRTLIQKNPNFIELKNRLALVLYMQGKYNECSIVLNDVLDKKPWHFEAIQLQVLVSLSYQKDIILAIQWARKGLPPLHHTKHRTEWVTNAVTAAKLMLQQLEDYDSNIRHTCTTNDNDDTSTTITSSSTTTTTYWQ